VDIGLKIVGHTVVGRILSEEGEKGLFGSFEKNSGQDIATEDGLGSHTGEGLPGGLSDCDCSSRGLGCSS
jgi:hypothetical protein